MNGFVPTVALIGIVIVVASLASGIVERVGVPLVAAFLLLGAALGPSGFGLIDIQLGSPSLQVLATLGLALVLFSDAVSVDTREVRQRLRLAIIVLGPGTLVPAIVVAAAAHLLLDLSFAASAVLGAAISSTDPVLLRTVIRSPGLPPTARVALRLESGMNDVALLPVVVLATLAMGGGVLSGAALSHHLVGLFLLGPVLGALVGWVGISMLTTVRDRIGVRRDYESLYALGLGFAAYAAAESVGGSGFLAAFAAGFAIATLDVELCDCFLEYGEATAEMLLLLTFVALGTSLIWTGLRALEGPTMLFAVVALSARTVVLYPVLAATGVERRERKLIAVLGPRGLSSLLLVLIPVFAGVAGAEQLFTITSLVVLLSLVAHGALIAYYLRGKRPPHVPGRPAGTDAAAGVPERITIAEARELEASGHPVVFADARAPKSWAADERTAAGAVRIPPDDPVRAAQELRLSQRATLVVYCA